MAPSFRAFAAVGFLVTRVFGGSVSYRVTENRGACHEVHLGTLNKPREIDYHDGEGVSTGYCHPEIRAANEAELYLTAACQLDKPQFIQTFPLSGEKYAVDLSHSSKIRRIDEEAWKSATPLPRGGGGFPLDYLKERGIQYKGRLLERSGPKWAGIGEKPVGAIFSLNTARAAVNSWDGFDITYSFLDPTSFGKRNKIEGRYWIDIYDTGSGQRMIQIQGSFRGAEPAHFQGEAAWYGDRYYVMPVGGTLGSGEFGLRRLLICDAVPPAATSTTTH